MTPFFLWDTVNDLYLSTDSNINLFFLNVIAKLYLNQFDNINSNDSNIIFIIK